MTITLSWWMIVPLIIVIGTFMETLKSKDADYFVGGVCLSVGIVIGKLLL